MISRNLPTQELEAAARRFWLPNPYPDIPAFIERFYTALNSICQEHWPELPFPSQAVIIPLAEIAGEMWHREGRYLLRHYEEQPNDPIAAARYRDNLLRLIKLSADDPDAWTHNFIAFFIDCFIPLLATIPENVWRASENAPPALRLMDALGEPFPLILGNVISNIARDPPHPFDTFFEIRARLLDNLPSLDNGSCVFPEQHLGTPDDIANIYLQKTPLLGLFLSKVPVAAQEEAEEEPEEEENALPQIDERHWYQHCLLLAGTGGGKTNAIRWRIVDVLFQVEQGQASMILMEPKGVLTRELIRFVRASGLEARLTVITPGDPRIAVNVFEREDDSVQGINATIARISRIFSTITLELTAFQRIALTFALRAMFSLPPPVHLHTLMHILRNGIKGLPIQNLSLAVREFFEHEFKAGSAGMRAANEIISRLNGLIADPVFESLFSAERTTFDIGREMQTGKVIVIDSSAAAPLYSRFWIEEIARTIRPRLALPFTRRMPTSFIIDEAQQFIADDLHFAEILDMAREARIGMLIAAHHMGQITNDHVRNSLYTNTALKFVARTSADIFNLCRSMGQTEPDFLNTLPQYHFGFFGPNMRQAIDVKLPLTEFVASARQQESAVPSAPTARSSEPIITLNERPPEIEPWRLDHSYKPPAERDFPKQSLPPAPPATMPPKTHTESTSPQSAPDPYPPSEGATDWHC